MSCIVVVHLQEGLVPGDWRPHHQGSPHLWSHQDVQSLSFLLRWITFIHKEWIERLTFQIDTKNEKGNLIEHDVVEDGLLARLNIALLHLLVQKAHLQVQNVLQLARPSFTHNAF